MVRSDILMQILLLQSAETILSWDGYINYRYTIFGLINIWFWFLWPMIAFCILLCLFHQHFFFCRQWVITFSLSFASGPRLSAPLRGLPAHTRSGCHLAVQPWPNGDLAPPGRSARGALGACDLWTLACVPCAEHRDPPDDRFATGLHPRGHAA